MLVDNQLNYKLEILKICCLIGSTNSRLLELYLRSFRGNIMIKNILLYNFHNL